MVASGFAGLGYQIVWTQQFALWLGHEAAAVLAVVTAFFAGLGVGALVLGRRIDASARPERSRSQLLGLQGPCGQGAGQAVNPPHRKQHAQATEVAAQHFVRSEARTQGKYIKKKRGRKKKREGAGTAACQ
jgi:hypothetical protein